MPYQQSTDCLFKQSVPVIDLVSSLSTVAYVAQMVSSLSTVAYVAQIFHSV